MNQNSLSKQTSVLRERNTYTKKINNCKSCYNDGDYCEHNNRILSIRKFARN
ncbi:hypothetical protein [Anaerosporobacter sp.]